MPKKIKLITWEKYIDECIDFFIARFGSYHTLEVKRIKNTDMYILEVTILYE